MLTGIDVKDSGIARSSSELIVHRTIDQKTSALAVIHCHPRTAIALSLSRDEIIPLDVEGSYLLHKVPVVAAEFASGSPEMADLIANALREYKIAMLRGTVASPPARLWRRLFTGYPAWRSPATSSWRPICWVRSALNSGGTASLTTSGDAAQYWGLA